jgi:hypothetical protein
MIKLAAALLSLALCLPALAEDLAMPAAAQPATTQPMNLPEKGSSMQAVSRQFGEPRQRHAAAGGDSAVHPPITRWDYEGFSVFFENQHVIHAVRPDAPTPLARRDGLSGG